MRPPEETTIGGARKTLPTRRARKVPKANRSRAARKPQRKNASSKAQEQEWIKIFEQK